MIHVIYHLTHLEIIICHKIQEEKSIMNALRPNSPEGMSVYIINQ